ncbi:hypothetical protein FLA105534_03506 [Flavobacterium bizetiae]|uniref:Uncharacterized protein n=1 Tax=Flavobacterium bizetiae TaxID=2704140 RepID=A0A6J4GSL6_9FLAO|nr:hypothetical protein [Flavobacterium bizetiae]CAA9201270.1 hypothetical protein FLA105534_03506 [Flavobacterium bizetiae]CAD5344066.1 hypothetical protein FLA105535_04071 [Flavobacterium bizetiae]CAD5350070.1 hypothetical protein FLA105534_04060 [Flavobacterium bizetiae]
MQEFKIKYEQESPEPILGIDWNLYSNRILIAYRVESSIVLEIKTSSLEIVSSGKLKIGDKLKKIALNDNTTYALLVFEKKSVIVRLSDYSIFCQLERNDGFLDGAFAEKNTVYLTIPASSGSVDWSFWDYVNNDFQEYELERYEHYGRGAVLHPSKKLIGACWSAYQSGFLIHSAVPENKRLKYFNFGENECSRSEYEASCPSFNTDGDKIAFIVNPYLGGQENIEKLCIYDIENQSSALIEIPLPDFKNESVLNTYFMGQSEFVLLHKRSTIDIVELESKVNHQIINREIEYLSVNPYTNQFVVSESKKLSVYSFLNKESDDFNYSILSAVDYASSFVSNHINKLKVAGDKEVHIHAAISNTDEIPKVYVKFGFERAIYRLDSKEIIEEKLSESTKLEVTNWFDLNQETQLFKWKENNNEKKKTILKSKNNSLIEIFSGQRAMEQYPNIRIYYENSNWMVDVEDIKERESLPEAINEIANNWIDLNYIEIIKPWKNTADDNNLNLVTEGSLVQPMSKKSSFWVTLKNLWS